MTAIIAIFALVGVWTRRVFIAKRWKTIILGAGCFLVAQVVLCWPLSMMPALHYDWGLYYQQSQKWAVACPVVPGLGNLHARLAFPGTSFLLAGLLDHVWGASWGARLLGAQVLGIAASGWGLKLHRAWREKDSFNLGLLLSAPLFVGIVFDFALVSVAAPDLLSALLVVHLGIVAVEVAQRGRRAAREGLLLLGLGLVELKLSNLVIVACLFGIAAWKGGWRPRRLTLGFNTLLGGAWLTHNWIQSGYPLFPAGFAPFAVDWMVDPARRIAHAQAILGWARLPGEAYRTSLQGWSWIEPWTLNFLRSPTLRLLGAILVLRGSLAAWRRWRALPNIQPEVAGWMTMACWLSLLAWFVSAPDERFALGVLWLLGGIAAGSVLVDVEVSWMRKGLCGGAGIWILFILLKVGDDRIAPLQPRSALRQVVLHSGLRIWVPGIEGDDKVWNAPLPATPEVTNLVPRGPTLCDGFRDGDLR